MQEKIDMDAPTEETRQPEPIAAESEAIAQTEPTETTEPDETPEAVQEEDEDPLLRLRYRLPIEPFYQFHMYMNRDAVAGNRKKMRKIGIIELVIGAAVPVAMLVLQRNDPLLMVMGAGMIMLGLWGIFYYDHFYPKALRRAATRQHQKVPYFQNEIGVDFYEDRCVERSLDSKAVTLWKDIFEFRETDTLYLLMLEEKRCLLIPKIVLSEQEQERISELIDQAAQQYGKKRVRV